MHANPILDLNGLSWLKAMVPSMSPVSPVFYAAVSVRIGLKTQFEWEHPFHNINGEETC